ncbi:MULTISPECIES: hypothetical protein [Streptomyces]|uniref:hypothetical protein n=1 Tax=Streptomyces TaxID=1883 RepID=UPI0015FED51C|nr:hypothetical protein [Streptomyces sp. gCLA4]
MTDSPDREPLRSRLKSHVGWWMGIIAAIAGILAFAVTYAEKNPSFAEWKAKAISVCEKEVPGIVRQMRETNDALSPLYDDDYTKAELRRAADSAQDTSDATSHFAGGLRDLKLPDDNRDTVADLITSASEMARLYRVFAEGMYDGEFNLDNSTASADAATRFADQIDTGLGTC